MKKYFRVFLTVLLVFALTFTFHADTVADIEQDFLEKVDPSLLAYMETADDDELIPINISLREIDEAVLMEKVESKTGMNPDVYLNETRFQNEIVSKIADTLEQQLGYEEAHKVANSALTNESISSESINEICLSLADAFEDTAVDSDRIVEYINEYAESDRSVSVIDYTVLKVRKNFQKEKNRVVKEEQSAANDLFISNYVAGRNSEVIYASRYISSLFLKATKEDIIFYAQKSEVVSICYTDPSYTATPTLNYVSGQVGADSSTGTKGANFNHGNGYKGSGITIGIIEAGGVCDTTSPHYDSSRMHIVKNGNVPQQADTHASLVTAIVAGKRTALNGYVYTGIVPEAEVYITNCRYYSEFIDGLEVLADQGVDVINISLGFLETTTYTYIDRELDRFINTTGITCVVAAGNNADGYGDRTTYISSPSYALNCITVGNLKTKSSSSTKIGVIPYSLNSTSSWKEPSSVPNKPDICAPGTWIRAVRTTTGSNNFYYDLERLSDSTIEPSGTSFAAPIVTGIVAQMMQQSSAKIGRPQAVKAKIMNTANLFKVTTEDNATTSSGYLREKSGAGLVNAAKAMSGYAYKYAFNHQNAESSYITQFTVNLETGQQVKATLAFSNKNTDAIITGSSQYYDMDLRIVDASTGKILCAAAGVRNNVEIVEYTATENCVVYIQTRIARSLSNAKTDWALEVDRY